MTPSPPRRRDRAADLSLVAAGPVLWGTHLLVAYALVPWACHSGSAGVAVMVGLTTFAAAAAAVAAATALQRRPNRAVLISWAPTGGDHGSEGPPPSDRRGRNRHIVAFALAAGFAFAVVLHALVAILVDPCA